MKRELFFLVLLIIGIALWYEFRAVEAFQNKADPVLNIPKTGPEPKPIGDLAPKAFAPPSDALLAPPPGQMASVNSYPYEDPTLKKAALKYIKNAYETLQGFLTNEAPGLKESGDPAVKLPMETARSDLRRLQDEIDVLARNPGIESSLTMGDLNGINANMGYLQKKWRLSANTAVAPAVEGFSQRRPRRVGKFLKMFEGFDSGSGSGSGSNQTKISLQQLTNLETSIAAFIVQLQMSGTTSPVTLARIDTLNVILYRITDIVNKIQNGSIKESDIPITPEAYKSFLPFVDPNSTSATSTSALPALFAATGSSPGLANLFPVYFAGDVSGAQLAQQLLEKYAGSLFKDISYDVNINFGKKSQAELALEQQIAQSMAFAALGPNGNVSGTHEYDEEAASYADQNRGNTRGPIHNSDSTGPRGEFDRTVQNLMQQKPGTLDWKERSGQICEQIVKRGMNPRDYGCLEDPDEVDPNFSYRGYAKMVCSRLGTNYDPGIPELCGCPPATWSGWKP